MERDAREDRVGDLQPPAEGEVGRRGAKRRQGQATAVRRARAAARLPHALRDAARALPAAPRAAR